MIGLFSTMQQSTLLQVDPGHTFMGYVSQLLTMNHFSVWCGIAGAERAHHGQAIEERFNRTLAVL